MQTMNDGARLLKRAVQRSASPSPLGSAAHEYFSTTDSTVNVPVVVESVDQRFDFCHTQHVFAHTHTKCVFCIMGALKVRRINVASCH
jgi:hypothetical protein